MKTAFIDVILPKGSNEFIFDSNDNNEEIIKQIYEKELKKFNWNKYKIIIEDDEDYDEEQQCYSYTEYQIENGEIKSSKTI